MIVLLLQIFLSQKNKRKSTKHLLFNLFIVLLSQEKWMTLHVRIKQNLIRSLFSLKLYIHRRLSSDQVAEKGKGTNPIQINPQDHPIHPEHWKLKEREFC